MDHIGIDVHKKESQIGMLREGGELVEQRTRMWAPCPLSSVLGTI